ncbi:acyltransferase family protein [Sphingobacterium sp. IITKGP-BTPF85]|uniref:acyltransferase family protein n=1 Tax=Sphingobacterium sp. IITKGP-BTPF85 TaxID=1338009 RepID=UPI0003F52686|nr:acyltransferase [Sphingobacterium sp. IITKGP-BTPF85]
MKSLEKNHRKDIDGLRAVAVISVIIFHLGFLPFGYLGVDVFFVISGYLITKIIYTETVSDSFSIVEFYLRRIRRIIPLVLFVIIIALCIGIPVMLPDDLENLSQSIIATNFMANNILLLITTGNYWDAVNEFKPLMHTWSLGVEEQFYFIVPLIFLILRKERIKWALWILSFLALLSFLLYILPFGKEASKFYLIQYRFFEIAFGGILAIIFQDRLIKFPARFIILFLLLLLLGINVNIQAQWTLILVVFLTGILLITKRSKFEGILLENKYVQFIGKISFSLYMWHQIVLGFGRYFVFSTVKTFSSLFSIILVTFLLSVFTFYFIERPFRDKKKVGTKKLLLTVVLATIFTSGISFYLYSIKGVIRDVTELNLFKSEVILVIYI